MKHELAKAVLSAANGEIVGRIRFQKIFYLLDQLGMKSGYDFSYHHYGPYSEELSRELAIEVAFSPSIQEEIRYTSFGSKFSVYQLDDDIENRNETVGELDFQRASGYIEELKKPTSVVIELAATIHWLIHKEKVQNWTTEIKSRKPEKATDDNVKNAVALLEKIELH